jgi:hypothetical protein
MAMGAGGSMDLACLARGEEMVNGAGGALDEVDLS